MTTLREAAQQALNFFSSPNWGMTPYMDVRVYEDAAKLRDDLRAALAQQEQEDIAQNLQSRLDAALLLEGRRQEIAQPCREKEQEQAEPVLVVEKEPDYMSRGHFYEGSKPFIDPTLVWKLPIGTKLYTAPPRRKWRGLSDTEVLSIHQSLCNTVGSDYRTVARAVEAALKEKNNG
jgi:hypothetical protein